MTGHLTRLVTRNAATLTPRRPTADLFLRPIAAGARRVPTATRAPAQPAAGERDALGVVDLPALDARSQPTNADRADRPAAPLRPAVFAPAPPVPSRAAPAAQPAPMVIAPSPPAHEVRTIERREVVYQSRLERLLERHTERESVLHTRTVGSHTEHTIERARTLIEIAEPGTTAAVTTPAAAQAVATLRPNSAPESAVRQAAVAAARARQLPQPVSPAPVSVQIGRVELTVAAPLPSPAAPEFRPVHSSAAPGHPDLLAAHREHLPRRSP